MKVSTNSWHYRLVESFLDGDPSPSLCIYFWQVSFRVIFLLFAGIFIWGFFAAVAKVAMIKFGWFVGASLPFQVFVSLLGAIPACLFFIIIIFIWVGILVGVNTGIKALRSMFENSEPGPEKKENVVLAYIKAKKNKVCPTIDFE